MLPGFNYEALLEEARKYVDLSDQVPQVARGEVDTKSWIKQRKANRERLRQLVKLYDSVSIQKIQ